MAGTSFAGNASTTHSPFPQPPDYALSYTTDNIKNQRALKPPPVPKKFTVFGEEIDMEGKMIQSLSEMGLQQMYSSTANWKSELKKLNKSVVAAFLDLLEILIKCPDNPERREKIETIRMLFINMHHLINEYRPVQARDTLRHMMIKQNKEITTVTEKMQNYIASSKEAFDKVLSAFKEFDYDSRLSVAPDAHVDPPEFERLSFKSRMNDRLTSKGAKKHEFICQNVTMQNHLQLLKMADQDEKYSDSFTNFELEEIATTQSPQAETEATQSEENIELEDIDEMNEGKSSSEHENLEEDEEENNLDAAVEFMMDDEDSDGELMDVLDESSGSNASPMQQQADNKTNPTSPEFVPTTVEYQEPPSEFVDDAIAESSNQSIPFEQPIDDNRPPRSHSTTPENFLEQEDNI